MPETRSPWHRLDDHLRRWVKSVVWELRRTRRVIVAPEARHGGETPIFLTGVHRSGTTLLRLVVDSHSRIACPPESFFVAPLGAVLGDPKAMEGLAAMGFDERHVLDRLRESVSYFFEMYAAARGKPRWADKTPSYIDCLDFIDSLFGVDCRYVMLYRHGLDVATSIASTTAGLRELTPHVEACGDLHAGAARYWALQCAKMLDFESKHAERCFALRYEALASEPEGVLRPMFEFLEEPWEPGVLRFHEKPHDHWVGLQDGKAAESRGFALRADTWRGLPAPLVERMLQEAGPLLERLGYPAAPAARP